MEGLSSGSGRGGGGAGGERLLCTWGLGFRVSGLGCWAAKSGTLNHEVWKSRFDCSLTWNSLRSP